MQKTTKKFKKTISPLVESEGTDGIVFRMIPNGKHPKLIISENNPSEFNLYRPFTLGGRILKWLFKAKFFRGDKLYLTKDSIQCLINDLELEYHTNEYRVSFYIGTPSPYQTLICQITDWNGNPLYYVKVANTKPAVIKLRYEYYSLCHLSQYERIGESIPTIQNYVRLNSHCEAMVLIAKYEPQRHENNFSEPHHNFLIELWRATKINQIFHESRIWNEITQFDKTIVVPKVWKIRYQKAMLKITNKLASKNVSLTMAHGDFAPWNLFVIDAEGLYVYDWEMAEYECIPGYDVFHFNHVQNALLGKNIRHMYRDVDKLFMHVWPEGRLFIKILEVVYLIKASMFYLDASIRYPDTGNSILLGYYGRKLDSLMKVN